jgi:hypothetical protein
LEDWTSRQLAERNMMYELVAWMSAAGRKTCVPAAADFDFFCRTTLGEVVRMEWAWR